MFKHTLVVMMIGVMTAITSQAAGQVRSGTKVGTLNCQLAPGIGFIIGSHDPMRCRYTPDGPFPPEFYDGVITNIGLDMALQPVAKWRGQSSRLLLVRHEVGLPVNMSERAPA